MLDKIKRKLIGYLVTIMALILLTPHIFFNFFFTDNKKTGKSTEDEELYKCVLKYGGPPEPYDRGMLKILKIKGILKNKESNKPISNLTIKLKRPEIKTLSSDDGSFLFELYNLAYKKFEFEVIDHENNIIATKKIEINYAFNNPEINSYNITNSTVEIFL